MNDKQASKTSGIEISDLDLINESVANAIERRNSSLDSKEFLSELSDAEAKSAMGGIGIGDLVVLGMLPPDEIFEIQ